MILYVTLVKSTLTKQSSMHRRIINKNYIIEISETDSTINRRISYPVLF